MIKVSYKSPAANVDMTMIYDHIFIKPEDITQPENVVALRGGINTVYCSESRMGEAVPEAIRYFNDRYSLPRLVMVKVPGYDYELEVEYLEHPQFGMCFMVKPDEEYRKNGSSLYPLYVKESDLQEEMEAMFDAVEMLLDEPERKLPEGKHRVDPRTSRILDEILRPLVGTLKLRGLISEWEWEQLIGTIENVKNGKSNEEKDGQDGEDA